MTEQTYVFLVQGSAPQPYEVIFSRSAVTLAITCTCPAGDSGLSCKHRVALLAGDASALASENRAEVPAAAALVIGTDLERALRDLAAAESALDKAKQELAQRRRAVARIMNEV